MFRYKKEKDVIVIELKLAQVSQLFDMLDPSPFPRRDLDPDATEYIFESAREFPLHEAIKLQILLPKASASNVDETLIVNSIHNHFAYEEELKEREIRQILRNGRSTFLVGLIFLVACIGASHWLALLRADIWGNLFSVGLNILGWVAMWQPLETFLYAWQPVARAKKYMRKLKAIQIEFVFE